MFDDFMTYLPLIVIGVAVGSLISWLVIRGAVLSALRKHAAEQAEPSRPQQQ